MHSGFVHKVLFRCLLASLLLLFGSVVSASLAQSTDAPSMDPLSNEQLIKIGVEQLLKIQNEDGAWPYEGVYRVSRKIPVGYRIGGTAICCEALLYGGTNQPEVSRAIESGVELILKELDHPLMKPSQESRYDVRVWGHIYALDLFCRINQSERFPNLRDRLTKEIESLTKALLFEEIESGGWNYANRRAHAGFVTAPAVQSLLWARQCGQDIPREVFQRSAESLFRSRNRQVAFAYSGFENGRRSTPIQGSIARSAVCESTLALLGQTRTNAIDHAISKFHEHWEELEKRRKKTGTHKPPFGIAPYYFYYGHRYIAQAIQFLPAEDQAKEYRRLRDVILQTRDEDGTWNDRVFDRSRAYGTAMVILALLEEKVPNPIPLWRKNLVIDLTNLESEKRPKDVSLVVAAEIAKPDLTIEMNDGKQLLVNSEKIELNKLAERLTTISVSPRPSLILIETESYTRMADVNRVQEILRNEFGEVDFLISVK